MSDTRRKHYTHVPEFRRAARPTVGGKKRFFCAFKECDVAVMSEEVPVGWLAVQQKQADGLPNRRVALYHSWDCAADGMYDLAEAEEKKRAQQQRVE